MAEEQADRIAELEGRVAELTDELSATRKQLADAQLDQWKARIDELEVQMHLGRLEAEQQVQPVVDQLRDRWLDARDQIASASSAAGDVFGSLRSSVEAAMEDLRSGMREARSQAGDD